MRRGEKRKEKEKIEAVHPGINASSLEFNNTTNGH
jgi:hypothetical protein